MSIEEFNFFRGFEGHAEVIVTCVVEDAGFEVRMYDGHLGSLMDVAPLQDGRWTGIALEHHLLRMFDSSDEWVDPAPDDTLRQLGECLPRVEWEPSRPVGHALIRLYEFACANNSRVEWVYE